MLLLSIAVFHCINFYSKSFKAFWIWGVFIYSYIEHISSKEQWQVKEETIKTSGIVLYLLFSLYLLIRLTFVIALTNKFFSSTSCWNLLGLEYFKMQAQHLTYSQNLGIGVVFSLFLEFLTVTLGIQFMVF